MPGSPPRWVYGDTVLFAATGFVVASVAPICAIVLCRIDSTWFREQDPRLVLVGTLLLGLVLSCLILNADTLLRALAGAFVGAPLTGGVAGAVSALGYEPPPWREISFATCVLGGVLAGAVLSIALTGAGCIATILRSRPAHDGFDRLLTAIGAWLLLVHAAAAVPLHGLELGLISWMGVGYGCAALGLAVLRQRLRRRWFERVRAGADPHWALREWSRVRGADALIPLFGGSALACDAVLVHVAMSPGSAYRAQAVETPVLLAPGPERSA